MNTMLKFISIVFIVLMFLNGCTSQNNQSFGQNFDQLKASKTRVSLGLTYLKNGNFSQAKFNLDKALEFAPRSADANFAMAYYYQNVSENELAEKSYQFAMDLEPKNANIANSYGAFLCQNGNYEKAKKYFLKAVNTSRYNSSAETYENLAVCSRSQGRPEDAIEYLRSAVNHQPGRANSLFLLARSLIEVKQWQEARLILRRYEKISQSSSQSLLMAMNIERGTGNEVAAKGYLDMLLKIYPNDAATQLMITEQQTISGVLSNVATPPVLIKESKQTKELIGPQTVKKSFEKVLAPMDNNDLLADTKNANIGSHEIANVSVEIVEQKINSITQVENDISVITISPQKNRDLLANIDNVSIETDDIADASKDAAERQIEQATQVESEISDIPSFHVVAEGENLYRISLLYNIKMQRLIDWNGLTDASAIFDGKKLFLVAPSVLE
jgi:type IV pilus assembly protein PilF